MSYCRKRMQRENLKSSEELQTSFMHEIIAFMKKKSRTLVAWDEIYEGGLFRCGSRNDGLAKTGIGLSGCRDGSGCPLPGRVALFGYVPRESEERATCNRRFYSARKGL